MDPTNLFLIKKIAINSNQITLLMKMKVEYEYGYRNLEKLFSSDLSNIYNILINRIRIQQKLQQLKSTTSTF